MALIVDASVGVKWLIAENGSEAAIELVARDQLIAPDIFPVEIHNALASQVRRKLLSEDAAREASADLDRSLPLLANSKDLLPSAFDLALALAHPVYDCVYLALALDRDLPLVTADRRLARVAEKDRRFQRRISILGEGSG